VFHSRPARALDAGSAVLLSRACMPSGCNRPGPCALGAVNAHLLRGMSRNFAAFGPPAIEDFHPGAPRSVRRFFNRSWYGWVGSAETSLKSATPTSPCIKGVTLGGTSGTKEASHPPGRGVVVGAGAKVLDPLPWVRAPRLAPRGGYQSGAARCQESHSLAASFSRKPIVPLRTSAPKRQAMARSSGLNALGVTRDTPIRWLGP